jgi:hypothetical protein
VCDIGVHEFSVRRPAVSLAHRAIRLPPRTSSTNYSETRHPRRVEQPQPVTSGGLAIHHRDAHRLNVADRPFWCAGARLAWRTTGADVEAVGGLPSRGPERGERAFGWISMRCDDDCAEHRPKEETTQRKPLHRIQRLCDLSRPRRTGQPTRRHRHRTRQSRTGRNAGPQSDRPGPVPQIGTDETNATDPPIQLLLSPDGIIITESGGANPFSAETLTVLDVRQRSRRRGPLREYCTVGFSERWPTARSKRRRHEADDRSRRGGPTAEQG